MTLAGEHHQADRSAPCSQGVVHDIGLRGRYDVVLLALEQEQWSADPLDVVQRRAFVVGRSRSRERAHQPVEVARLELVRLLGEQRQVGHAEETHPRAEGVVERESGQHDEPAGRSAADAQASAVDDTRLGEVPCPGDAVLDVGEAPGAAQPLPIGPPVAGGPRVVDVEDRQPREVKKPIQGRGTVPGRRGTAVRITISGGSSPSGPAIPGCVGR